LFNSRTNDDLICVRVVIAFAMVLTIASGSFLAILIGIGALALCGDIDTVEKRGAAACRCFFTSVLCIVSMVISFVLCAGDGDTADAVYCSGAVFIFLRAGEGIAALLWMMAGFITLSLKVVMPLPAPLRARREYECVKGKFVYISADDKDSINPSTELEMV
jgi:hypothetical protein